MAAVIGRYHELRPEQGSGWLIGLDVAFRSDPSAAVVVGRDPENRKRLVVGHAERWLPKRSRKQRRRAKTEQERLDVAATVLDAVARCHLHGGVHDWPTTLAAYWFLAALMTSRMTLITSSGSASSAAWPVWTMVCLARGLEVGRPRWSWTFVRIPLRSDGKVAALISSSL